MRGGCPVAGAGAPGSGAPRTLFLTAFTIDFLRFDIYFTSSVWVLRTDSILGHVWYGSRTNLGKGGKTRAFAFWPARRWRWFRAPHPPPEGFNPNASSSPTFNFRRLEIEDSLPTSEIWKSESREAWCETLRSASV